MNNLNDISTAITYIGSLQKVKTMEAHDKTSREFQKVVEKIQLNSIPKDHIGSIQDTNTSGNVTDNSKKTEEVTKAVQDGKNNNPNTPNSSDKPKIDENKFSLYLNNGGKVSKNQGQIIGKSVDTKV